MPNSPRLTCGLNFAIQRFGLDGEDPKTLREIGDRLGLTRERVRRDLDGLLIAPGGRRLRATIPVARMRRAGKAHWLAHADHQDEETGSCHLVWLQELVLKRTRCRNSTC